MASETFKKRQKEMARREKQQKKAARRIERKDEKARTESGVQGDNLNPDEQAFQLLDSGSSYGAGGDSPGNPSEDQGVESGATGLPGGAPHGPTIL